MVISPHLGRIKDIGKAALSPEHEPLHRSTGRSGCLLDSLPSRVIPALHVKRPESGLFRQPSLSFPVSSNRYSLPNRLPTAPIYNRQESDLSTTLPHAQYTS